MAERKGVNTLALLGFMAAFTAWGIAAELAWPARALMSVLVGLLPAFAVAQSAHVATLPELPSRWQIYFGTIFHLWGLALAAAIASYESGISAELIGVAALPAQEFWLWLGFSLLAIAAIVLGFRAFGIQESPIVAHMIPQRKAEQLVYAGVSLTAGICEELVFRGFLIATLMVATGSLAVAVVIAAIAFGIAHTHQHIGGAIRATLLGLVLSVPLIMSGSLYPGIVAHTLVDLLGGLWLSRWLLRSE